MMIILKNLGLPQRNVFSLMIPADLVIVCLWILAPSLGHALKPCPPPRFDIFCERIIGDWSTTTTTPGLKPKQRIVEEVMRSCGGAVQGIQDCDVYLNRADDCFCFFDCGTYAYGPINQKAALAVNPTTVLQSSIAMPTARIWLLQSGEGEIIAEISQVPSAKFEVKFSKEEIAKVALIGNSRPNILVHTRTLCRMSSPVLPWMMQRAQWESHTNASLQGCDEAQQEQGPFRCWIEALDGSISMGVSCTRTGYVKEVVRSYDGSGNLNKITLQEGYQHWCKMDHYNKLPLIIASKWATGHWSLELSLLLARFEYNLIKW